MEYKTLNAASAAEKWLDSARKQSESRIDYGVAQGVAELERELETAQDQFKEQAESVALDEAQGLDNSALYAELRGDRGGIGRSQYNEIQAAGARNRLAVQQAQTALGTETARRIADLRAQGEFEKADAALELTQQYLAQLMEMERWAAEFGLDEERLAADLAQWQAEYELDREKLLANTNLAYGELDLDRKKQLAALGKAMLEAGLMPSAAQLSAMGMTAAQAQSYLAGVGGTGEQGRVQEADILPRVGNRVAVR